MIKPPAGGFVFLLNSITHPFIEKYNDLTIFTGCELVVWKSIIVTIADLYIIKRKYVKAVAP